MNLHPPSILASNWPDRHQTCTRWTPGQHASSRGVATGWISVFIPPKSAQVNVLWGKMTSERLFNSFIHPLKLLYPQNKFLATPLASRVCSRSKSTVNGHVIRALLCWRENHFFSHANDRIKASSLQSNISSISVTFARWKHYCGRSLLSTIALFCY